MTLHLIDNTQFSNEIIRQFETAAPKQNIYVILNKKNKTDRINSNYTNKIKLFNSDGKSLNNFVKKRNDIKVIIIHFLTVDKVKFLERIDNSITLFWSSFGQELNRLYSNKNNSNYKEVSDITLRLLKDNNIIKPQKKFKKIIRYFYSSPIDRQTKRLKKIAKKVDYFSSVLLEEESLFRPFLNKKCQYLKINYASLNSLIENEYINNTNGNKVLLGQSAFPENNHYEIIEKLSEVKGFSQEVICPLSYGNKIYAQLIYKEGKRLLGKQFIPLLEFLPNETYLKKISDCGFFIMNSIQQQAIGNLIIMLYSGAKVFVRKNTTVYKFLKNNDFIFNTIDEITNNPLVLNTKLNTNEIIHNRKALDSIYSETKVINDVKIALKKIYS